MSNRRPRVALPLLLAACAGLLGCARGCPSSRPPIHINPNMDWQPRYDPQQESDFFYDGSAMRVPVPGTVARGQLREDVALDTGRDADGAFVAVSPLGHGDDVRVRGAARFAIYCQPCHDRRGTGKGILSERGGVPVPSFHEPRIRALADGEMFDVITNGKGLMSGYRWPITARDRWAVIAHVRALQEAAEALP